MLVLAIPYPEIAMIRYLTVILLLLASGCVCQPPEFTRPDLGGEIWDTTYLIDADPSAVTIPELGYHAAALEILYWNHSQVNGVLWPAWRSDPSLAEPDRFTRGSDSCLFTGQALAAYCFQYKATKSAIALEHVERSMQGMFLLTHATGVPGVVCRQAFPSDQADRIGYPDEWGDRIAKGFVNTGPALIDPFSQPLNPHIYYTRATKDQMTGVVLGLAAVRAVFTADDIPAAHAASASRLADAAKQIIEAVYLQLIEHDWDIRDENGNNDTSADHVDGLLKAALLAVMVDCGFPGLDGEYENEFDAFYDLSRVLAYTDKYNNFQQYFAYNLRVSRALAIWLLEGPGSERGEKMAAYIGKNIWRYTSGHQNAWFAFARAITTPEDVDAVDIGLDSLRSLSLKPARMWMSPYAGQEHKPGLGGIVAGCGDVYVVPPHLRKPEDFSTWQKEPWDVGVKFRDGSWDTEGRGQASGVDYLLPYWLGKAFNLF